MDNTWDVGEASRELLLSDIDRTEAFKVISLSSIDFELDVLLQGDFGVLDIYFCDRSVAFQ